MHAPGLTFASLSPLPGERFLSLRRELGIESFGINLISLEPGQRGRIHAHERQEEAYLVVEGELTLLVAAGESDAFESHTLGEGRIARVAPALRRQLVNASDARVVVLALGGSGEHVGRDGLAFETWDAGEAPRSPQEVPLPQDVPS